MQKSLYILILYFVPFLSIAQVDYFMINNQEFSVVTEVVDNEWESKDTVNILYRIEDGAPQQVLHYFIHKDDGGDCNNLFWNKESMKVDGDNLTFTTHFFQKTGIDPIPEWRKQIYQVNSEGELILIYDKYKYYNSDDWLDE